MRSGRNVARAGRRGVWLATLGLLGLLVPAVTGTLALAEVTPPTPPKPADTGSVVARMPSDVVAGRDSLMAEIRLYSRMIRGLQDSLSSDGSGLQLSSAQREKLENSIADVSEVIERISRELARMEFEIKDNRISLVNESGEGIVINVPENLDEHVSQGIEAITKIILSELPDSVDFDGPKKWDWKRFQPKPPAPERRVINGNVVKVWDDVQISDKEDVRGNVVVIFGDAEVAGRVDGAVVTVFGNTSLDDSAEVTGNVVTVGGYLEQDPGAQVDDVVVMDPLHYNNRGGWLPFLDQGAVSFLVLQGVFLLTILLALAAVAMTPADRFTRIIDRLKDGQGSSLGLGIASAVVGHMVVAVLMAILVLTVIGVPLALLVGLALLVVVVISVAVCGALVGERLLSLMGSHSESRWLQLLVGMVVLHVASFLGALLGAVGGPDTLATSFAVLGFTIKALAYLFGLGALVATRFGTRQAAIATEA